MDASIEQLVSQLATVSPLLLAYTLGGIVAIARWRRHPQASLWALLGLGLLFLEVIGSISARVRLMRMINDGGFGGDVQGWFLIVGMAGSLAQALGIVLLLVAAFVGRGEAPD
jgi:hypothetical protein